LDTDKHASPFDILTTIDLYPQASILKYDDVTVEDSEKILFDSIFPRGEEGVKFTKFFINGSDVKLAEEILEKIKHCMTPPFESSIIIDPRGAYTTAVASVAKTLEFLRKKRWGTLKNKQIGILGGTGSVGQTAAKIFSLEKAKVSILSRSLQKANNVAAEINREVSGHSIQGLQANGSREIKGFIEKFDIILSAGAQGIRLVPIDILSALSNKSKLFLDVNAIPPLGIEGVNLKHDGEEIFSNIFGIGALSIGTLKNWVEQELIKKAAKSSKGIFSYEIAYELAKKAVLNNSYLKEKRPTEVLKFWSP
jgi:methylene-tetrahydromethanopterin dehydrogenase